MDTCFGDTYDILMSIPLFNIPQFNIPHTIFSTTILLCLVTFVIISGLRGLRPKAPKDAPLAVYQTSKTHGRPLKRNDDRTYYTLA